jgi:hypothetical protein
LKVKSHEQEIELLHNQWLGSAHCWICVANFHRVVFCRCSRHATAPFLETWGEIRWPSRRFG